MINLEDIQKQRREFDKIMKDSSNLVDQIRNISRNKGNLEGQFLKRAADEFQKGVKDAEKGNIRDFTKFINSLEKEINGNKGSNS